MNIVIALSFFIFMMVMSTLFFEGNNKEQAVYMSVPLLFLAFNISFNSINYRIVGENLKDYVNTATLVIFGLLLCIFNKKTLKITWEYIFFIPLFLEILFFTKDIYNFPNFLRQLLNYLSIYMCFLIGKSVKHISLTRFMTSFNLLAILNGILGIAQMITKKTLLIGNFNSSILYTEGLVNGNRAVGIAGSNNSAGNLAALLFVVVLFNFIKDKNIYSFIAIILNLIFALLTQTRIGLLAIAITLLIVFINYKPKKRTDFLLKNLVFIFLLILGLCILIFFGTKIIDVLFLNRGDTAGERFIQYKMAFNTAIANHPITGIGTGQWRSYLYGFYKLVDIPIHSQYLNFFVENGIVIFILNIIFNVGIFISCIKLTLKKKFNVNFNVCLFVICLFVTNIIVSNFNPNQIYTLNNVVYYLIIFITQAYLRQEISIANEEEKRIEY
jgi:hypothetical protein